MNTIENYAEGDAIQIMISTNGKTICGKYCGSGWRTRQIGAYMSDVLLQQLSQDIFSNDQQNPVGRHCQRGLPSGPDKVSKNHFNVRPCVARTPPCRENNRYFDFEQLKLRCTHRRFL